MAEQDPPKYELTRAFIATVRLAQLDLNAIDLFDRTPQAAWRSLRFVFYCVPFLMLLAWWESGDYVRQTGFSALTFCLLTVERVLIASFGFLLVVHHLGMRLGYNRNFAQYVTAQFSVAFPVTLVVALLTGMWKLAGVAAQGEQLLNILVYAFQILIDWAITCGALRVKPAVAFGLCVMAVLFSMFVQLAMTLVIYFSMAASSPIGAPL